MKTFKVSKTLCYLGIGLCLFTIGLHLKIEGIEHITIKKVLMFDAPLVIFGILLFKFRDKHLFKPVFEEESDVNTSKED